MKLLNSNIIEHYSKKNLFNQILMNFKKVDININSLTVNKLNGFDEFHIGGLKATLNLINQLDLKPNMSVLDIGCGIGGAARQIAFNFKANVTGIDLTKNFIETAIKLTDLIGLHIKFKQGDALNIPYDNNEFDVATLFHVGMNINNKEKLFLEVSRILNKKGKFAIYDIMRLKSGAIQYPVPWSTNENISFIESHKIYYELAKKAGFDIYKKRIRKSFAIKYFKKFQNQKKPKKLGIKIFLGGDTKIKMENVENAIKEGLIAPVEMIFEKI